MHIVAAPAAGKEAETNKNDETASQLYAVRRQGHSVPSSLKGDGGSAVTFLENKARRLTHAEKARTLLAATGSGTLCTLHHDSQWPYGSVINFVIEERDEESGGARLLTFVSKLAEHTANMAKDDRVSLLVSAVQGQGDRLATTRGTFLARAKKVEKTDGAKRAFLTTHPNAYYVNFDDFLCFEFAVHSVRYIGGFGEMSWVGGDAFAKAEIDPIAADMAGAADAVDHCNKDHADAVLQMAQAFSGLEEAEEATMLSVDRYGFDVLCSMPDGLRRSRVEFSQRLEAGGSLRVAMMDTTQRARDVLAARTK
jgi:putative heme iron utilization protein